MMAGQSAQPSRIRGFWALVKRQHGVIAHRQLLELGFTRHWIHHRVATGKLHRVAHGVYAVGRPELSRHGNWMKAVLQCHASALLSHESAGVLWGVWGVESRGIEVSIPATGSARTSGVTVHRRRGLRAEDTTRRMSIPVTAIACTITDLAARLDRDDLEEVVNTADRRNLISPPALLRAARALPRRPGTGILKQTLDPGRFLKSDSRLERRFLEIIYRAGLPRPKTQKKVNGHTVDFWWPALGLVVETDGLTYHRTASEQSADRIRDQDHTAAGLTHLRFTRQQVWFAPERVEAMLRRVAERLRNTVV